MSDSRPIVMLAETRPNENVVLYKYVGYDDPDDTHAMNGMGWGTLSDNGEITAVYKIGDIY